MHLTEALAADPGIHDLVDRTWSGVARHIHQTFVDKTVSVPNIADPDNYVYGSITPNPTPQAHLVDHYPNLAGEGQTAGDLESYCWDIVSICNGLVELEEHASGRALTASRAILAKATAELPEGVDLSKAANKVISHSLKNRVQGSLWDEL